MKKRLPEDGLLVHHYQDEGVSMVEVHVDLDDSFDAARASLPLGGRFSVRFPGKTPACTALRKPPMGLPAPGAGLHEPPLTTATSITESNEVNQDDPQRNLGARTPVALDNAHDQENEGH